MICIDSDCIIDFLKGREGAVKIIEKYQSEIITTEINVLEVYFGILNKPIISDKEKKSAEEFFNSLESLPFKRDCGRKAAEILTSLMKEGKTIQQNDSIIAAILNKNNIQSIITKNAKHFSSIHGLKVISY